MLVLNNSGEVVSRDYENLIIYCHSTLILKRKSVPQYLQQFTYQNCRQMATDEDDTLNRRVHFKLCAHRKYLMSS